MTYRLFDSSAVRSTTPVSISISLFCVATIRYFKNWLELGKVFPISHNFPTIYGCSVPVTVAARSKVWVCCRSLVGIAGSIPAGTWISVFSECCLLSGRGFSDWLITRPEDSYRVRCVWVWSWSLYSEEALATRGLSRRGKNNDRNLKFSL